MPLRDLLKKKEKIQDDSSSVAQQPEQQQTVEPPMFKIMRSDTHGEELLDESSSRPDPSYSQGPQSSPSPQRPSGPFRRISKVGATGEKEHKSFKDKLHLHRDKAKAHGTSPANLPTNLPDLEGTYSPSGDVEDKEYQWEERATVLASAQKSPAGGPRPNAPTRGMSQLSLGTSEARPRSISDAQSDVNIQNAIRLHEEGRLVEATNMFKQLADQGNVLSEVLFGLALRHGWGCDKDEEGAFTYLSSAASDSATLEAEALKAGLKKGGAAKGELVLAIFELGNCYRYGWGTAIDKPAAR